MTDTYKPWLEPEQYRAMLAYLLMQGDTFKAKLFGDAKVAAGLKRRDSSDLTRQGYVFDTNGTGVYKVTSKGLEFLKGENK
jgi:hypothetical protein